MTTIYIINDETNYYNGCHFEKIRETFKGIYLGLVQIPQGSGFRGKEIEIPEDSLQVWAEYEE